MNRREFLVKSMIFGVSFKMVMQNALAAIDWLKAGTLGYKEVAPEKMLAAGKMCSSCKWYRADAKVEGGGLCKQVAVAKGKEVYVKDKGHCNMWVKI